jgi:ribokinase
VILDPAPAVPLSRELLTCADYVTPNETELAILTGGAGDAPTDAARAARLRSLGARQVIVKQGGRGALLVNDAGEQFWPALPVQAVDTTAAGDAFNAAFAVALAEGRDELEAVTWGCAAGAHMVEHPGVVPGLPTREQLERRLASRTRVGKTERAGERT